METGETPGSSTFFDRMSAGRWPSEHEALAEFMTLTRDDVEVVVHRTMRSSPVGRTWFGLQHTMDRKGYKNVRELGVSAATAWAVSLGVIPKRPSAAGIASSTTRSETSR